MGRGYRAVWDGGGLLAEYEGDQCVYVREDYAPPNRSDLPSPGLISDQTKPFKSMADGKTYDSKSAYRATLRAKGLVELGSDAPIAPIVRPPDPNERRRLLHRQLADVSDRQADKALKALKKQYGK